MTPKWLAWILCASVVVVSCGDSERNPSEGSQNQSGQFGPHDESPVPKNLSSGSGSSGSGSSGSGSSGSGSSGFGSSGFGASKSWVNVANELGVDVEHFTGAGGSFHLPETMSGGGGFLDYDGDGLLDILVLQGCSWPESDSDPTMRLFRGIKDGAYEDVTKKAGLDIVMRAMGMCSADYDNDGDTDIFVTAVGSAKFFVNDGKGHFEERGEELGIHLSKWSAPAAFLDYDRDGLLDLIVGGYVRWNKELEELGHCMYSQGNKDYCPVGIFPSETMSLYHNVGSGRFEDVSESSGVSSVEAKALGIALIDIDEDGWIDVFVANDTVPYLTLRNNRDGTFEDTAFESGMALSKSGSTYAGMGVDVTYEQDGNAMAVSVGNFSGEPVTFREQVWNDEENRLDPFFVEEAFRMELARRTLASVTFGLFFLDVEFDGDEDLFVINGHVGKTQEFEGIPYRQKAQLFLRQGDVFTLFDEENETDLHKPIVGRGGAYGDVDGDGDLDILVFDNQGVTCLFENRIENKGHWLRIKTVGTTSNRDGIGASVRVIVGERVWRDRVGCAGGYLSQHELALTVGLGSIETVDRVIVDWPSGIRDVIENVTSNKTLVVREGDHQVSIDPLDLTKGSSDHPGFLAKALGMTALAEGRFDDAIERLTSALGFFQGDHVIRLQLIKAYLRNDELSQARQEVEALVEFYGDPKQVLLGPAMSALNDGDHDVELFLLEACRKQVGEEAWLYARIGQSQFDRNHFQSALDAFERAWEIDKENLHGLLGLVNSLYSLGRLDEGVVLAEELVEKAPQMGEAHETLAFIYRDQGLIGLAAEALEKSCLLDPGAQFNRQNLIGIYEELGNFDKVAHHSEVFLSRHPESPKAWEAMVTVNARRKAIQPAIELAREALSRFPNDPDIHFVAARAELEFARRPQEARRLIEKAVSLDESHERSWRLLGAICRGLGDRDGAIRAIEKVVELAPLDRASKAQLEALKK